MKTARHLILDTARRFDPSWIMATVMALIYASIKIDPDAPVIPWALNRIYHGTGIAISPLPIIESLIVGAIIIAALRPPPRWTFFLSIPLITYIGFAAWYGYAGHQLPVAVVTLLIVAYGAHFWIHVQASAILVALRHITELEARIEAIESGGISNAPAANR